MTTPANAPGGLTIRPSKPSDIAAVTSITIQSYREYEDFLSRAD